MNTDSNVASINPEARIGGPNDGDGNGGLVRHRLNDLERRMGVLESKVDDLAITCTRIETKLSDIASKSYVLWVFGVTTGILLVSLVGHALIRSLGSDPFIFILVYSKIELQALRNRSFSMPRPPRFNLAGVPQHVVQRGNNRQATFFSDADYQRYLDFVASALTVNPCDLHAYVLMPNHIHLLITPHSPDSLSKLMQSVTGRYGQYVNASQGRSGTLWGRAN